MHHSDSQIDGIEWFQNAKIPRYAEWITRISVPPIHL